MAVPALAAWTAVVALLWAGGLPIGRLLFPDAPDRGAALALPAALSVFGVTVLWVGQASLSLAPLAGVAAVLAFGAVAYRYAGAPERRALRWPVAVFLAGFALAVALRFVDPAIEPGGGEKFLDFALLQSLLRADSLPIEDPWFAGEPARYYYGGHLLVSALTRLSGVRPAVAFNLATATAYATMATAAYGVGAALVPSRARVAGVLGAGLAALGGHLATPGRTLLGLLPASVARRAGPLLVGYRTSRQDALATARGIADGTYSYWTARHVIPGVPTAFPLWTFVNGDMRPHMVGAGFLLLAAGICLGVYRSTGRRRRLLAFGALPVVVGLLAVTNTWDAPTTLGLLGLTLLFAPTSPTGLFPVGRIAPGRVRSAVAGRTERLDPTGGTALDWVGRGVAATAATALVAGLAALVAAPFLAIDPPVNRGVGVLADRSGPGVLVLAYGGFLGVFALYLLGRGREWIHQRSRLTLAVGGSGAVALGVGLSAADLAGVAILGPFLVVGVRTLYRHTRKPTDDEGFETVLIVAGACMVLVCEFVYAKVWPFDPTAPRWNTLYKVSMQLWLLWGVAAGAALARVLGGVRRRFAGEDAPVAFPRATVAVAVALLVGVAAFPTLALLAHFDDPGDHQGPAHTLDGRAFVERARPAEAAAADWLAEREGRPTLLARPGRNPYGWRNVPSTLTGIPTVAGWIHEAGYHGLETYRSRAEAVEQIYAGVRHTPCHLLAAYDVEYVYVGPAERSGYDVYDFSELTGVETAYRNDGVRIYAVESLDCPGELDRAARGPLADRQIPRP